ncbi:M20/M25/M40 family metallo-hydrolase [Priestia koreensis]|uniref:M20/M25/M40 family metallo-hydrolase n=1 Tax=Priestia koreensis TaxID=284581 RepID=UPI0020411D8B|nr:M20/M25/M40 family metallo-hydrolase [Priestia koreensis]MCM3003001.1 M20/M25/M40 family metallo-hydrolase [Priestia koreensis]
MTQRTFFQTADELKQLLCHLVSIPSVTGTKAEQEMGKTIYDDLGQLPYFQTYKEQLRLHPTGDGRYVVAALAKHSNKKKTVVLISHYDVVDVQDYGVWKDRAFSPEKLTDYFYNSKEVLPPQVKRDVETGNWLFGRGTMDMKCGLALHMSMIEQAANGAFDGNVLLLSVPDEEVNSAGMRSAVTLLLQWQKTYDLEFELMLNGEPMFARYPGDETNYVYTGSIGKIMPAFYCYGKETHVGEPFAGLNANLLVAKLTSELELNVDFCEVVEGQVSPAPTSLMQRDLKEEYSVQIPHRSVGLYNLTIFNRSIMTLNQMLLEAAERVASSVEEHYHKRAWKYGALSHSAPRDVKVRVMTYEQLYEYAILHHGQEHVESLHAHLLQSLETIDERERSIKLVDELAILCKELAPMIVLFYTPPYYPAICSTDHPLIQSLVKNVVTTAKETYAIALEEQLYFGGISDLSYAGLQDELQEVEPLIANLPLWQKGYAIPFAEMAELQAPVFNVGPIGRDAHQWTERLELDYAFGPLKELIEQVIHGTFSFSSHKDVSNDE